MAIRTAHDDFATIVCSCGISFFDNMPRAVERHELRHHAATDQLTYALFSAGAQDLIRVCNRTAV